MSGIAGQRVLVVGASGGLGRVIARRLGEQGARVGLAARRYDRVAAAAAEIGDGAVAVRCDVRDPSSCRDAVTEAVESLGGLDGLVFTTGVGLLQSIDDMTTEEWTNLFATNVMGAASVTSACAPHLADTGGRAIYLSSISASAAEPWPGLGGYATSKAALEKLIEAFAVEYPAVRFTTLVMGDSGGGEGEEATGFVDGWDGEILTRFLQEWVDLGLVSTDVVHVDDLVQSVTLILSSNAHVPRFELRPSKR